MEGNVTHGGDGGLHMSERESSVGPINIIEPTLSSQAGHCFSFVSALISAGSGNTPIRLWVNKYAQLDIQPDRIEIRRYFHRWARRFQAYRLFRKLLAEPGKLFISTATYTDLRLFDWAAREAVPQNKAYFYVHWFRPNDSKFQHLRHIAQRQPNLVIFGPTPTVVDVFRSAGFAAARVIPYPISARQHSAAAQPFRHLLFAGAARRDKGFAHIVDLVELLHVQQASIPFTVQISAEHFGKYDADTLADIKRLQNIPYPHLHLLTDTLSVEQYEALFPGAIAMQLYDVNDFSDRISGVTLDAFSGGCPVLTTGGTWIARMVQRFDAGQVVDGIESSHLLETNHLIISEYGRYAENASKAGVILQQEHSAGALHEALTA